MSVGRPKGRNKFQVSLSLNQQHRDWLLNQPNSSALISGLINALKAIDDVTPEYYQFVIRKTELDSIENKLANLKAEKQIFLFRCDRTHFKGEWVDDRDGRHYEIANFNDPEPIDSDGQILKRKMGLMSDAIKALEAEADKIKTELLAQQEQSGASPSQSNKL